MLFPSRSMHWEWKSVFQGDVHDSCITNKHTHARTNIHHKHSRRAAFIQKLWYEHFVIFIDIKPELQLLLQRSYMGPRPAATAVDPGPVSPVFFYACVCVRVFSICVCVHVCILFLGDWCASLRYAVCVHYVYTYTHADTHTYMHTNN